MPTLWSRLGRNQRHTQDLIGVLFYLCGCFAKFDPASLASATGMYLSLYCYGKLKGFEGGLGLMDAGAENSLGYGDGIFTKQLLGLVFMDFH